MVSVEPEGKRSLTCRYNPVPKCSRNASVMQHHLWWLLQYICIHISSHMFPCCYHWSTLVNYIKCFFFTFANWVPFCNEMIISHHTFTIFSRGELVHSLEVIVEKEESTTQAKHVFHIIFSGEENYIHKQILSEELYEMVPNYFLSPPPPTTSYSID